MRAHIFIDGANIYHGSHDYGKDYKLDYEKLAALLSSGDELIRTHFYTGVPEDMPQKEQEFLSAIDRIPNFEVKTKPLKEVDGKRVEKGVDVLIACDMLWNGLEGHCEHIILVSGDDDLTPAVKRLKDAGIVVSVAAYKKSASHDLVQAADTYIDLAKHLDELEL